MSQPAVTIYVDEYGDRGFSQKANPYFCVTAVLVPSEAHMQMRATISGMRATINTTKPLHWVDHFRPKHHDRRLLAAKMCAALDGVVVVYALAHKQTLICSDGLRTDNSRFYHYVTKLALERAAFALRSWPGGARHARVVLAAIKGTDPEDTLAYYRKIQGGGHTQAPVELLLPKAKVSTPGSEDGLQLADLHQGMFATALRNETDSAGHYLWHVRKQVRRNPQGAAVSWGLKLYPPSLERDLAKTRWWPHWGQIQL